MNSLADALVYAVAFINAREGDDDSADADVAALESIAGYLADAKPKELDALAAAARRAVDAEASSPSPRQEFLSGLTDWMENMFGDDWAGNDPA